jgi:hypothetical protein
MTIHDRLRQIIADKKISISKFERTIGVGQNSVSSCLRCESSVNHEVLLGVKVNFPEYSLDWIITGKKSENEELVTLIKNNLRELEKEVNKIT